MGRPKLSKDMLEQGWRTVCGHLRPPLQKPVAGIVCLVFIGPPPTATHHDKSIGRRGDKMILINNPTLREAHNYYARQMPPRQQMVPIAGPIYANVTFWFPLPRKPNVDAGEIPGYPCQNKPDRDNAVKVLFDELAIGGWIDRDEQITDGPITKRWAHSNRCGVIVWLSQVSQTAHGQPSNDSRYAAWLQPGVILPMDAPPVTPPDPAEQGFLPPLEFRAKLKKGGLYG